MTEAAIMWNEDKAKEAGKVFAASKVPRSLHLRRVWAVKELKKAKIDFTLKVSNVWGNECDREVRQLQSGLRRWLGLNETDWATHQGWTQWQAALGTAGLLQTTIGGSQRLQGRSAHEPENAAGTGLQQVTVQLETEQSEPLQHEGSAAEATGHA